MRGLSVKSVELEVYVRGHTLYVPTTAETSSGIGTSVPPVDVHNWPLSDKGLAEILERARQRSGRKVAMSMPDPLDHFARKAGCRNFKEFQKQLHMVSIRWTEDRTLVFKGIPEKGGFVFSDAVITLPRTATYLECAASVNSLLREVVGSKE
jgi:hypothetical protein